MERETIINELEKMNLNYDDLDKIQLFLINNSYTNLGSLVFKKDDLKNEEFIFYMDSKELLEYIERGNGKIYDRDYCQLLNDSINFYTLDKVRDIILNYTLYDSLYDMNKNILNFLVKEFNVNGGVLDY